MQPQRPAQDNINALASYMSSCWTGDINPVLSQLTLLLQQPKQLKQLHKPQQQPEACGTLPDSSRTPFIQQGEVSAVSRHRGKREQGGESAWK